MTADGMYDTAKIRKYNRRRGIKSNIPVNKRNRKKKKRGRPIKVDKKEFKRKSAIERFFSQMVMQESISRIRNQRNNVFES